MGYLTLSGIDLRLYLFEGLVRHTQMIPTYPPGRMCSHTAAIAGSHRRPLCDSSGELSARASHVPALAPGVCHPRHHRSAPCPG